ncbi:Uncharacterized protein FWK35_00022465 [Aphis craccivora]|uniref:Double jelly roll-like domain-containing protein n=1 Tax=Aphis craccivora TaxID=307492 RepID=A0A6G0XK70_APHCR|nr:Uncharacterized protein FWK35_00022465 [Aphis craccivora]
MKVKKNPNSKRLISTPGQSGGAIPLIPIFAVLSALGSLMSGSASVYNAIKNSKIKKGSGFRMPDSDILDISSPFETDSKITKIEYHSYTPYRTSFNNNDEIQGQITDPGKVNPTNYVFFYLFEQIRLEINRVEVDSIRVIGITSSLKGYLSVWKVPHINVDDEERSFETFEYPELGTTKKVKWNLKTASKLEKPRFTIIGLKKGQSYYEQSIRNPTLSPSTFLTHAPIIVIDTSKQNDSATASSVDVQIEIDASESLSGVTAYCLLIHDRIVEYVTFTRENEIAYPLNQLARGCQ